MKHSYARNVSERCFGLLKMRWAILRAYSYFPIKTQFCIITACCLLHNLIQREMPMDLDDDENEKMNPPPPATELEDEMIDVVDASDQWGMDDTDTTSSHKKGKPQRFWNHCEELFLITTMKDVIASNHRWKLDNNQFRASFYNESEKKILSAFLRADLRATPHIDSKIKLWRKQYNTLQDMLKISGFGDTDYSMSTASNVSSRADSTKTGKKQPRPAEGIPTELSEMTKYLGSCIENTNTTMVEIAHRIGYSHDLS
ncbi:hypothetical protein ACSBR2_040783 [Camellia fascicularis]